MILLFWLSIMTQESTHTFNKIKSFELNYQNLFRMMPSKAFLIINTLFELLSSYSYHYVLYAYASIDL